MKFSEIVKALSSLETIAYCIVSLWLFAFGIVALSYHNIFEACALLATATYLGKSA